MTLPAGRKPDPSDDLFAVPPAAARSGYSAKDIEVLEGLEPVRRRPGMFIGGTDERALHHLAAEVLDNAMDEAIAGFATWIEFALEADGSVVVRDNGRGIPVDPHPKVKGKSALEVILTTLHSGGKFSGRVYTTAGGLHGVGVSVVNALSDRLTVEVAREQRLWRQSFARGAPSEKLRELGRVSNRRGTLVRFHPDPEIFGPEAGFRASLLYRMAREKAYLFRGVEIRWSCDPARLPAGEAVPRQARLRFPGGLADYLALRLDGRATLTPAPFAGAARFANGHDGRLEWAVAWPVDEDGFMASHVNTIATPQGGTHEAGFRAGLAKSLKAHGDRVGNRQAASITGEDVLGGACALVSVFIAEPQFQGQTKERLSNPGAARLVEAAIGDHFDHWLSGDPAAANALLGRIVERACERRRRRREKEVARKQATRRLRLPGKLADCARAGREGTEIFLVEGDSAGGSAKQARRRDTQAVLPLRGKILNVASASAEKLRANRELADLALALGCGVGTAYDESKLRYQRVIIMTDADVDGAHIATLLMTFFYREMPELIANRHLFLAQPPLYRLTRGDRVLYAHDDADRDRLMDSAFPGPGGVEVSRFKGLGEMPPAQLRETTMDPARRALLRVEIAPETARRTAKRVEDLMGRKPERRFEFIQKNARFVADLDV